MFTQQQVWRGIELLARRQGCSISRLAVGAGLDASALNPSKRRSPDGQPRWPSTQTLSRLLSVTGTSLADFARLLEGAAREAGGEEAATDREVLIVDDDRLFREKAAATLRAAGYRIHLAADHRLALELLDGNRAVGLVCTDVVMPHGLGGPALARRALLRRPDLQILFVTSYDFPRSAFRELGGLLHKPFAAAELVDSVARLVPRGGSRFMRRTGPRAGRRQRPMRARLRTFDLHKDLPTNACGRH